MRRACPQLRLVFARMLGALGVALGGLTACGDRPRDPAPADTASSRTAQTPPVLPTARPSSVDWDSVGGPLIAVRGAAPSEALVLYPGLADGVTAADSGDRAAGQTSELPMAAMDVFDRTGRVGKIRLRGARTNLAVRGRPDFPKATAYPTGETGGLPVWSVGFLAGRAAPIPLDSIEALPSPDSARLAAEVTRLASALPNDTAAAFRGIPFAVRTAYRFAPTPNVDAVAAEVVRTVSLEANPRKEHILLIAERPSADPDQRYQTVYSSRASGAEERVESTEVLAAVALGRPQPLPTLVLGRVGEARSAYALLERRREGKWRVRWTSPYARC